MALTNGGQKPGGKKPPLSFLVDTCEEQRGDRHCASEGQEGSAPGAQSSDQLLLHSSQPCSPVLCDHFLIKKTITHKNKKQKQNTYHLHAILVLDSAFWGNQVEAAM